MPQKEGAFLHTPKLEFDPSTEVEKSVFLLLYWILNVYLLRIMYKLQVWVFMRCLFFFACDKFESIKKMHCTI